jgi:uncharacterized protein with FMN-binding domain
MKAFNIYFSIVLLTVTLVLLSFQPVRQTGTVKEVLQPDSTNYPDGTYEGKSQDGYAGMEPFWGVVRIKVEKGAFTAVHFMIRDTSIHECVDSLYGIHHYGSYPDYKVQCVKDGNGIRIYPQDLLQTQDMGKVDALSGATWSYNIFKASVKAALTKDQTAVLLENKADQISVKVYPNPFDSSVTIAYQVIDNGQVDLSIFNEEGRLVKQLVNESQVMGPYTVRWDDCPKKGVYFYRLQAGENVLKGPLLGVSHK